MSGHDGRVRATAVVDAVGRGLFTVTVTGEPPHAQTRVYTLPAADDNSAAMTGLRFFVDDMEGFPGNDNED